MLRIGTEVVCCYIIVLYLYGILLKNLEDKNPAVLGAIKAQIKSQSLPERMYSLKQEITGGYTQIEGGGLHGNNETSIG